MHAGVHDPIVATNDFVAGMAGEVAESFVDLQDVAVGV
jgi:hypothetical protein